MNTAAPPPRATLRLLPGALLAAALASAAGAVALGYFDLAGFVAARVVRARGTMSPETSAWLHGTPFRALLGWAAAGLAAAAALAWHRRHRWAERLARTETPGAPREAAAALSPAPVAAFGALVVFLRYLPTLWHGFFRFDDFDLISVAHHEPWWRAVWLPHGDHFLPLTRLIASAAYALGGTTAWPYNVGVLVCLAAMVAMGCLLLAEFKVSRAGQLLFIALVVPWSPWGEIMAGYYILSSYTLIAALGLGAVWCTVRWDAHGRRRHLVGAAGCTLAATLLDISGWYVPPAVAVFLIAGLLRDVHPPAPGEVRPGEAGPQPRWRTHGAFLAALALACVPALAGAYYAYAVAHPGLFLSMGGGGPRSLLRLLADFAYVVDVGLLVSFATPFVYARLPVGVLAVLAAAAGLGATLFLGAAWRRADRRQRLALGAGGAVVAGICLMVILGRPSEDNLLVRWAAKHVGPAFAWLCLLLALAWHVLWRGAASARRVLAAEATCLALGGYWIAQAAFGQLGLAVAYPPFGYAAEIRDATVRRAALAEIAGQIIRPIARAGGASGITAPTLDGPYLAHRCPSLFEYNLSTYAPFFGREVAPIRFVRHAAMHPWYAPDVATVPSLRAAVSPAWFELLRRPSAVRDAYFARVPLTGRAEADPAPPAAGAPALVGPESPEWTIHREPFDPEARPILRLALARVAPAASDEIALAVVFRSDLAGPEAGGTLRLPAAAARGFTVDLRQLYAFALSRQVEDLRLVFTAPGSYRILRAELGPP